MARVPLKWRAPRQSHPEAVTGLKHPPKSSEMVASGQPSTDIICARSPDEKSKRAGLLLQQQTQASCANSYVGLTL